MTRQRWFGATLAVLGGIASGVHGQSTYQAADRPPVVRAVAWPLPSAMIGRPVLARAAMSPTAFPPAYRTMATVPPAEGPHAVQAIPVVPPPGTVIATSAPGASGDSEGLAVGEEFAAEWRSALPVKAVAAPPTPMPAVGPALPPPPAGDWKRTFPVDVPLPAALPPAVSVPNPVPPPRMYFGAEYLLWWTKSDHAPPLVTTGAAVDPPFIPGALGNGDTVVLQDGRLDRGTRSGGRFTAGVFLDDCANKSLEFSGFFLGSRSTKFDATSAQFPVLSRPFFNVVNGMEAVEQVAFPGQNVGRVSVNAPSQLWGLEANLICPACCGCDWRVNWLAGPRFLSLTESLSVTEDVTFLPTADPGIIAPFTPGDRVLIRDTFATKNRFWGGQVGAEGRWIRDRWTVDGRAKIGFGVTEQEVAINGTQTFLVGVNTDPRPGGLLAVGSNIGTFHKTGFAVVPEVGASLGYYVTDNLRVSVGYNFLYWSNVVRPGQQIDRGVNPFLIPNFDTTGLVNTGEVRPVVPFKTTDYWAHGLTFGVEFNF